MGSRPSANRSRRGVSLLDLVVILAVSGVLVALLLPAMQAAREAARRSQCTNNLKQLGLSLHNYTEAHEVFPASYGSRTADNQSWETLGSWSPQSRLLPYFEAAAVYNAINFHLISHGDGTTHGDEAQVTAVTTRIDSFLCPSSPPPAGPYYAKAAPGNSYFASVGSSLHWVGASGDSAPNGIFRYAGGVDPRGRSRPLGIADIEDGTSATIAFGEWRIGDFDDWRLTIPQDVVNLRRNPPGIAEDGWGDPRMNLPEGAAPFERWIGSCAGFAPFSIQGSRPWLTNMSHLGQAWNQGMFGWTLGNTLLPPNPPYPNCRMCAWDGDWDCPGMYGLSSYHPDGCNVLFADGSVRFIKSSASREVIWDLGSRAGGEMISVDDD